MTGKQHIQKLPQPIRKAFMTKMRNKQRKQGKEYIKQFLKRESSSLWECLCAGWLMTPDELIYWKGVAEQYER